MVFDTEVLLKRKTGLAFEWTGQLKSLRALRSLGYRNFKSINEKGQPEISG
jgi:hypothetical protein